MSMSDIFSYDFYIINGNMDAMEKRRLSKRQQVRIKKMLEQKRERARQQFEAAGVEVHAKHGLVIAHYGRQVDIESEGMVRRCHLRRNLGAIAVGDNVLWQDEHEPVIVAVEPRQSQLLRYHKYEGDKLVAANVDQLFIVLAIEPPRAMNVIDRYLLIAETQQIRPVIIMNKIDLLEDKEQNLLDYYQQLGYPVIYASSVAQQGLLEIQQYMGDKLSIFVGLSGVGKSSLINALIPGVELLTGELSEVSREGSHTTTTAKLIHLPNNNGAVIDCPGIRELAIGELTPRQILRGFIDLYEVAKQCQFRDCSHQHEPGCAINEGLSNGTVKADRFNSYLKAVDEEP